MKPSLTAYSERAISATDSDDVLIAVDVSGSLGTGTRGRTKYELALEVAALLGLAATRNNDRVGLLLFTDRVERYLPPRKGREHALRVLREAGLVTERPEGTKRLYRLSAVDRAAAADSRRAA